VSSARPHPVRIAFVALTLALLTLLVLAGCDRDLAPPLVEVMEISPREIEVGDRLEIRGRGFPQGRAAHVTFRGTLHRAGEKAKTGVSIDLQAVVTNDERIDAILTEDLEERFCGRNDAASHTTFRGNVEVAFASSTPGAPPLVGIARGIVLDVRPPSISSDVADARAKEGARVLDFLGITPGAPSPRGLPIDGVRSPADRAGIQAGDVLAEVDGVRVANAADVLPASSRAVTLVVRHADGVGEETKVLPMAGYASERIPIEYGPALFIVGLALASLVLLVVPSPALLSVAELRMARRLERTSIETMVRALTGKGPFAIAFSLSSILVGTFALGPHVIADEVDGALLFVVAIGLLATGRAIEDKGIVDRVRAVLGVLGVSIVLVLSLAGIVLLEGALSLGELVRVQGALPWELTAFREPAAFVLALVYFGAIFWLLRPREGKSRQIESGLDRVGVLFACALGAAVFFGGWQIPGVAVARSFGWQLVGAFVFVAKSWLLEAMLFAARAIACPWERPEALSFAWRRLLPLLVFGFALALLSRKLMPMSASLGIVWGAAIVFALTLLTARSVLRIRSAMLRPDPRASPFL